MAEVGEESRNGEASEEEAEHSTGEGAAARWRNRDGGAAAEVLLEGGEEAGEMLRVERAENRGGWMAEVRAGEEGGGAGPEGSIETTRAA